MGLAREIQGTVGRYEKGAGELRMLGEPESPDTKCGKECMW